MVRILMDKLTPCSVGTWCRKWCYYLYMFSHAGSMLLWIVMTLVMPWLFLCANSRYLLICWNESQTLHLTDLWVSLLPVGFFVCFFFYYYYFLWGALCVLSACIFFWYVTCFLKSWYQWCDIYTANVITLLLLIDW